MTFARGAGLAKVTSSDTLMVVYEVEETCKSLSGVMNHVYANTFLQNV